MTTDSGDYQLRRYGTLFIDPGLLVVMVPERLVQCAGSEFEQFHSWNTQMFIVHSYGGGSLTRRQVRETAGRS